MEWLNSENKCRMCVLKCIYYKVVYNNRTFTINVSIRTVRINCFLNMYPELITMNELSALFQ